MELWSLMHFLMPTVFASHDQFRDWFCNPLTGMVEGSEAYNKVRTRTAVKSERVDRSRGDLIHQ